MFSNFYEIVILSAIQGITEFLPISSSAHLILINKISNLKIGSLLLDTGVHLGSLLAIIFYFKNDLIKIFDNRKLLQLIILGSLPTILIGAFLYTSGYIYHLRNLEIIAWTTLIFGILLYVSDKFKIEKNFQNNLSLKTILIIGFFQILSLIPGVSRSGIVITASRFLNFDRYDSTKISFYLSIPVLGGASFLSLKDLYSDNFEINSIIILSIIFSFIFSYITIKYFLIFIKKFSLLVFVLYRIILSLFLLYFLYI